MQIIEQNQHLNQARSFCKFLRHESQTQMPVRKKENIIIYIVLQQELQQTVTEGKKI